MGEIVKDKFNLYVLVCGILYDQKSVFISALPFYKYFTRRT
jgi:hypothetical protein